MDTSIVVSLNNFFSASAGRASLGRFLAEVPLFAILGLVAIAWVAGWGRAGDRRVPLVAGAAGALAALAAGIGIGHLYYRPRPFLALHIHPLISHAPDSSFYSDHLAVAGALTASLLLTRRWLGLGAVGLLIALCLGRVAAGVHYPTDVIAGTLAGAACFALLLRLRKPTTKLVAVIATLERKLLHLQQKSE